MSDFKPIPGFPDYEAGSDGTIVSLKHGKRKVLAGGIGARGYMVVTLCNGTSRHTKMVHRLVAETFLGSSSLYVNHKNGIKTDNCLTNLEFTTAAGNYRHAVESNLFNPYGQNNANAKLLDTERLVIRELFKDGMPQSAIAKLFGVSKHAVGGIVHG